MSEATKREMRDPDVQGVKCLRKIRPLLSRLRKVGTERDRAGERRLFMDHSCALILMSLFSPAIESLRDLQRSCAGAATASRARGVRCCAVDCWLSEGLPVPREPGYGSKRSQDGEAQRA
ncbi:MAG: hypothetical protein ACKOC8_07310 [Pirellulales bacterium]